MLGHRSLRELQGRVLRLEAVGSLVPVGDPRCWLVVEFAGFVCCRAVSAAGRRNVVSPWIRYSTNMWERKKKPNKNQLINKEKVVNSVIPQQA